MAELPEGIVLPQHIGIIMDGNGRWAKKRGLERTEGHKAGAEVFKAICDYACEIGIPVVTFYAFSTENWKRPKKEVDTIMNIFREWLGKARDSQKQNEERGMRMRFIGDIDALPADIRLMARQFEKLSADKTRTTVNLAINYGGRDEIANAARILAEKVRKGELSPKDITPDSISANLYTAGQPDPDLIIRPSGEYRLSNFMVWQAAYSEFWYSDVLWPDFTPDDLNRAIIDYNKRTRRFGGI